MASLRDEFLAYLNEQVENRSIYVWGAQGETGGEITEEWVRRREADETNAKRVLALFEKRAREGYAQVLRAFDCSGLIMFFLHDLKGVMKSDLSAAGLFHECTELVRGELKPGDLVFRDNGQKVIHVGVYVGNNMVIEAMGRDVGVVRRGINASGEGYWNKYGRLALLNANEDEGEPMFARTRGNVNIRTGRGVEHRALAVVRSSDLVLALPEADGWCEACAITGGRFVRGFISARYLVKVTAR